MIHRVLAGSLVASLLLVVAAPGPVAWSAPCVQACKPHIAACVGVECQGLKKKALRRCKRTCAKGIVQDCYRDLTVCGATTARPVHPGGGGPPPPPGGW